MGKSLIKSKTFWVNLIVITIALFTAIADLSLIQENPDSVAVVVMLIGLGNIVLRYVTKEPIKGTVDETS